jgi:hypothetical protein
MEEKFFFQYHMHMDAGFSMKLPINERKWMIERFIKQKNQENEALERAKRKAKTK